MTFAYNIERFISARQVYERCCRLKSTYSEKQADVHYLYKKKMYIYACFLYETTASLHCVIINYETLNLW